MLWSLVGGDFSGLCQPDDQCRGAGKDKIAQPLSFDHVMFLPCVFPVVGSRIRSSDAMNLSFEQKRFRQ